jgi:hypothetical protein
MRGIPLTPLTLEVARRVIWFEPPEQALAEPIRFMAYAMSFARHEDMQVIRRYVSDDDIREALDHAPAGIIDARSWAYWNSKVGRYPAPPRPVRKFAQGTGAMAERERPGADSSRENTGHHAGSGVRHQARSTDG